MAFGSPEGKSVFFHWLGWRNSQLLACGYPYPLLTISCDHHSLADFSQDWSDVSTQRVISNSLPMWLTFGLAFSYPAGTIRIKNVFVCFCLHWICTELVIKLLQIFTLTFFSSTGTCAWIGSCTSHANELTTLTFISCKWFSSLFTKNGVWSIHVRKVESSEAKGERNVFSIAILNLPFSIALHISIFTCVNFPFKQWSAEWEEKERWSE